MATSKFALPRRTFLRGAGVTLGLPLFDAMLNGNGTALAAGAPLPKRIGVFFWGLGNRPNQWRPAGTGPDWALSEELAPLANVKEYVSVLSGLSAKGLVNGHHEGRGVSLTGGYSAVPAENSAYGSPGGPSMDQVAARAWTGKTPFSSVEIGISRTGPSGITVGTTAWRGPGKSWIPAEFSPRGLFNRLFAFKSPEGTRQIGMQKGILDLVTKDAGALRSRLGSRDRARLDGHLDGFRDLERTLDFGSVTCKVPAAAPVDSADSLAREPLEERNKQMADILAMALACDLTRSFTFQFSCMQSSTVYWQIGMTQGHHQLTHDDRGANFQYDNVHKVTVFIMQQFAYLLERLKATPDGAGNLLDNSCVYATSEHSNASTHSLAEMPVLLCGRAGGSLKGGVHHVAQKDILAKAHLTCMRAVGLNVPSYGNDANLVTDDFLSALRA